ncbi:MFS transporter [Nisaea denitrificans]|uniref:MFS transporter n=1 Tax=Nisaea denitrificans TaxID=390877 RepID=UPI0004085D22|nr:MFS transporter [Nisaea denitrificans]
MSVIHRLAGAAYGTHLGDQIALVSVPLVAALVFNASAELIGILVACQSMAHLLGSIPFGMLVDRRQLRSLAIASSLIALTGFTGAGLGVWAGTVAWFGAGITLAGFGTVLFALTALSILPKAAPATGLARANAAIETPRALCSFAVPLAIGLLVAGISPPLIYAAAACAALGALLFTTSLPTFETSQKQPVSRITQILEGGRYVVTHKLLLAISFCAIFWNLAFAALLVVLVPAIRDLYHFDPGAFGVALSAFGLAAFTGSWLSGRIADKLAPRFVLLFGPGSSAIAAAGILLIGPESPAVQLYACFFFIGFGPSMWLIAQNSVRQLVTPPALLGRVNAVIQTAIYGVRPLGALIGGAVAGSAGAEVGIMFVVLAFFASFAVSLFSGLRRVVSYESLKAPEAA